VILYQDLVIALDPKRGVNNGSPSLHAKLIQALAPKPGERIVQVGAGAGYYSAILAELVGLVTAVEFDAALAERAEAFLSARPNVRVVQDDGARWPEAPADGAYVNFAVFPAGRLLDRRPVSGRTSRVPARRPRAAAAEFRRPAQRPQRGAQDRTARRRLCGARGQHGLFVCAEGEFEAHPEELERLRAAFEAGGIDTVRSLIWKRPALSDRCWFAGKDWALSRDETP
jgi:protein-L-isoaspartate(D-aspartate) O-methyltransferase